jgi:hypothetical protein
MSEIVLAGGFRSRRRVPALTWRDQRTGAVLARCSQPLVGVGQNRNGADEKVSEAQPAHKVKESDALVYSFSISTGFVDMKPSMGTTTRR